MSSEGDIRGGRNRGGPVLLVVSAPSGAGKTTLCNRLRAEFPDLFYSVSCTTRPPRAGERNGVDYHFLDDPAFRRLLEAGEFLEAACVHGFFYGTPRAPVAEALAAGRDVLMDIDVQGAAQIRTRIASSPPDDPIRQAYADVFVEPPSLEVLRRRLEGRGKDTLEVIERRLHQAAQELSRRAEYQYAIVNDDLELAYGRLRAVYLAEHFRTTRLRAVDPVFEPRIRER